MIKACLCIGAQAKALGVEAAALKECLGSGFNSDDTPVIFFEHHVMRQRLNANGQLKTVFIH